MAQYSKYFGDWIHLKWDVRWKIIIKLKSLLCTPTPENYAARNFCPELVFPLLRWKEKHRESRCIFQQIHTEPVTRYKLNINTSCLALHRFLSAGSRSTITHRPPDSWPAVGIFQHFESEIDEKKKKHLCHKPGGRSFAYGRWWIFKSQLPWNTIAP